MPVESVAGRCVAHRHILLARDAAPDMLLHILSTSHESPDVAAGGSQRHQSHRCEDCEAPAYRIRDDEGLIALIIGELAECPLVCICDRNDVLASKVDSLLRLQELLQQSEGNRGLGRGAALGDIDDAKLPSPQEVNQLGEVVLAHLISGK